MSQPVVSCIVPVFNGERYLREALESILAQTYGALDVIVIDDGSTDATAAIARSYGARVRYIRQDNTGAPAARNHGLRAARGELIAFLDADDVWHPEKLARQMARFAADPLLEASVTHLQNFWIEELADEAARLRDHPLAQPQPGYVTVTLLARRAVFERVGGFNTTLTVGDPMEWFARAIESGVRIELLPDTLVYRRMHRHNLSWESGASRQMTGAMKAAILRVVKDALDRRRGGAGDALPVANLEGAGPSAPVRHGAQGRAPSNAKRED